MPSPVPEDSLSVIDFHMLLLRHGTSSAGKLRTGHLADRRVSVFTAHKGGHKEVSQTHYNECALARRNKPN